MSLWERDVRDSLDELFDWNRDGKIDSFEEGLRIDFLSDDEEKRHRFYDVDGDDDDIDFEDDGDFDF